MRANIKLGFDFKKHSPVLPDTWLSSGPQVRLFSPSMMCMAYLRCLIGSRRGELLTQVEAGWSRASFFFPFQPVWLGFSTLLVPWGPQMDCCQGQQTWQAAKVTVLQLSAASWPAIPCASPQQGTQAPHSLASLSFTSFLNLHSRSSAPGGSVGHVN